MTVTKGWDACRAWVTGGSSGIGHGFALALAARGCEVHITTRAPESPASVSALAAIQRASDEWASKHTSTSRAAVAHALDLADIDSVDATVRALKANAPDLFVHAAHVFAPHTPIVALGADAVAEGLRVNVASAYALLRGAARPMSRAGFGRVVVVGSLASQLGGIGQVAYITEKAALEGLCRAFACEFAARGVLVNVVHPGIVDTANVRARVDAKVLEAFAQRTAAGRLLQVDEVVGASLAFLDPNLCALTGQALRISGGVDSLPALLRTGANGDGNEGELR
jgi:3-oxoacyl-[acyl-carrier protein] reductase